METPKNSDAESNVAPSVQADGQAPAPDRDAGPVSELSSTHPKGRDSKGRFTPGHFHSATTGLHTPRLPPEFAHLQADADHFLAASLSDEGDANDVPARRRSQLGYRAVVHRKILQLSEALERRGLFDSRGRLRVAWLGQLNALLSQARQQDQLLGLERRQKDLGDLTQWLNRDEAE